MRSAGTFSTSRKYQSCRRMGLISASLKNRELPTLKLKENCKGRSLALIGYIFTILKDLKKGEE